MKGINLLKISALSAFGIFAAENASAQEPLKENIAGNLGGTRFVITAPASVSGVKKINYATWGAAASPTIVGATIEKAYDTLGENALLNGTGAYPSLTGKFALIYRGGSATMPSITFSQKVNYCIAKGAAGVIIVNNVPGDPVGMAPTPAGSTVAVPVLMISNVDGQAISDAIKAAPVGSGIVKLTLGTWNTGGTHDLGVFTSYQATPHALNIPLHQLTGSTGTTAYKHYKGGAVANYGSMTETAVTVTDSVYWTPTSGSATYVTSNSYTVPSISVADSIRFGFGSGTYELTPPTSTGKYEHRYRISYGNTDDFPQDNVSSLTQNVTDSIFCKGAYDFVNARPVTSIGIRPGTASTFVTGNVFFVKNKTFARRIQFSLSAESPATTIDGGGSVEARIYKWTDGVLNGIPNPFFVDSFMESGELAPIGIAAKPLTTADSNGKTLTLNFVDIFDPTSGKLVQLDPDSWYYVAVEVPNPLFVGMDGTTSSFTRSYAQFKNLGSVPGQSIFETATGIATQRTGTGLPTFNDFAANDTNIVIPYPFNGTTGNSFFVDSVLYDNFDMIPAIALIMHPTGGSIKNVVNAPIGTTKIYPNPSTQGTVTVDVALAQKSSKVVYKITDLMGRTLYTEVHKDITNEKFEINTAKYATGNYFLMIITENGFENNKITIQN